MIKMKKQDSIKLLEEFINQYKILLETETDKDMKLIWQGKKEAFELSKTIMESVYCE